MANAMIQPTPGFQVTGPEEDMELSSELGAHTHDDIDIDIDLTGSGMKSPAHHDDSMIEDYKEEIDMDATSMNNDTFHDDEVMEDDGKVQDDPAAIDDQGHEEELLDLVDFDDDFASEAIESIPHNVESEQLDLVDELEASAAEPAQSVDENVQNAPIEEDLLDYSDGEEDAHDIEQMRNALNDLKERNGGTIVKPSAARISVPSEKLSSSQEFTRIEGHGTNSEQANLPTGSKQETLSTVYVEEHGGAVVHQDGEYRDDGQLEEGGDGQRSDSRYFHSSVNKGSPSDKLNENTDQTANDNPKDPEKGQKEDGQDLTKHIEKTFAENEDSKLLERLPVTTIVVYEGSEFSLFAPTATLDNDEFFLSDESLADGSIHDLLKQCREVLGESISDESELEIYIPVLDLCVNESCVYALTTTFRQIIDVYVNLMKLDGMQNLEPLYMNLNVRTKFTSRLANLIQAVANGKGLSHVAFQASELYDENTVYETEYSNQAGQGEIDTTANSLVQEKDPDAIDDVDEHGQQHETHELGGSANESRASGASGLSASKVDLENTVASRNSESPGPPKSTPRTGNGLENVPRSASGQDASAVPENRADDENSSTTVEAETSKVDHGEVGLEDDAFQDLLDDNDEAIGSTDGKDGHHQPAKIQPKIQIRSRSHSVEVPGEMSRYVEEDDHPEHNENRDGQAGEFDLNNAEEYEQASQMNDLDGENAEIGNEDGEFFLFDDDTTAVDVGEHDAEAGQSFEEIQDDMAPELITEHVSDDQIANAAHDEQHENANVGKQDDANDDIFDEIDFDNEDELPEFQDTLDTEEDTQAGKLQSKRSWDEHNADSTTNTDEQDSKRLRA